MKSSKFLLSLISLAVFTACTSDEPAAGSGKQVRYSIAADAQMDDFCIVCNYSPMVGKDVYMFSAAQKNGTQWDFEDNWTWIGDLGESGASFAAFAPAIGRPSMNGAQVNFYMPTTGSNPFGKIIVDTPADVRLHRDVKVAYCPNVMPSEVVNLEFIPILCRYDFAAVLGGECKSAKMTLISAEPYPICGTYNLADGQWSDVRYGNLELEWDGQQSASVCLLPNDVDLILEIRIEYADGSFQSKSVILNSDSRSRHMAVEADAGIDGVNVAVLDWIAVQQDAIF